jgi:hypothetical protein
VKRASRAASILLAAAIVTSAGAAVPGCTPVGTSVQAPSGPAPGPTPSPAPGGHG